MKRCPQCGRDYNDPTLSFCLDDGTALLDGPASMDEPATAILPDAETTGESPTRTLDPAEAEATGRYSDKNSLVSTSAGGKKVTTAIAIVIVLTAIAAGVYWRFFRDRGVEINSIAVMPFVNESGNADVEYLADGMTETLISSLTEIPNLSVKARSTVFYYKGKQITPKKIGEELGVEAVLLGRVVQRGDDLKLSLELVDTDSLDAIWSKSYDRKISDIVSLQSEVARNVLDKLRSKLSSSDEKKLARSYTTNPEAHQLYLRGRFYWNKRNIEDLKKAEEYFKEAIAKDPGYALAYSGLADTYTLMPTYGNFSPEEYLRKTEFAALKALELDPYLAEAYASLAAISMGQYDWEKSERELRKAIELNPNYAPAHHWLAEALLFQGKKEEAVAEIDKALEIDPYSPAMLMVKGFILQSVGRHDEAVAQGEKTVELYPDFARAHFNLGRFYLTKKESEKAAEHFFKSWEKGGEAPEVIEDLRASYEREGLEGLWQARLEHELNLRDVALAKVDGGYFNYSGIAWIYAKLGKIEETVEYLNKAYDQREPALAYLLATRDFGSLEDDLRYKNLLKTFGSR